MFPSKKLKLEIFIKKWQNVCQFEMHISPTKFLNGVSINQSQLLSQKL